VVSVDAKKELVGDFKNGGREWRPAGRPEEVRVHDFQDRSLGKAIPLSASTIVTWSYVLLSPLATTCVSRLLNWLRAWACGADSLWIPSLPRAKYSLLIFMRRKPTYLFFLPT
jgi:hypothetical protein